MSTRTVKVEKKTRETADIVSLELASADGKPLPPFSAGAHVDVHLEPGLVRQYSLCNDPSERHRYQIAVLRDPKSRGGSIAVHEKIQVGDLIQISKPRNHFALSHAGHYLLLAGGIGVTPILCMAERLAASGASFDMHYCSRSPERTAFVERIKTSAFSDRVQFHFDSGDAAQTLGLDKIFAAAEGSTHLYVCGPAGFIEFVTNTAGNHGWNANRVHLEYFGASPQEMAGNTAFEIKIASSGLRYTIPPDKSVCTALLEQGIDIPVSCEQGVCGTCITRVLEGTPDHRDVFFTDEEKTNNDQFMPCCSRAKSPLLILDL